MLEMPDFIENSMVVVVLKPSYMNPLQELLTEIIILQKYIPLTHLQYYFDYKE